MVWRSWWRCHFKQQRSPVQILSSGKKICSSICIENEEKEKIGREWSIFPKNKIGFKPSKRLRVHQGINRFFKLKRPFSKGRDSERHSAETESTKCESTITNELNDQGQGQSRSFLQPKHERERERTKVRKLHSHFEKVQTLGATLHGSPRPV